MREKRRKQKRRKKRRERERQLWKKGLWSPSQNLSSPAFPLLESLLLLLSSHPIYLDKDSNVVVLPLWTWTPQRGTRSVLPSPSLRFASTFMSTTSFLYSFSACLSLSLLFWLLQPLLHLSQISYLCFCSSHSASSFMAKFLFLEPNLANYFTSLDLSSTLFLWASAFMCSTIFFFSSSFGLNSFCLYKTILCGLLHILVFFNKFLYLLSNSENSIRVSFLYFWHLHS